MYFSKHRSHRSMEDSLSLPEEETTTTGRVMFQHNATLTDGVGATDPGVKMFVFPKNNSGGGDATTTNSNHHPRRSTAASPSLQPPPGADSDDDLESATTPIQFWSPVPEERSTPPLEPASTIRLPGSNGQRPGSAPGGSSGDGGGGGPKVNRIRSFFRWRTRSVPIAPNPSSPSAGGETSSVAVAEVPPPVVVADEGEGGAEEFSRGDEPATPPTPLSMVSLALSRSASVVAAAASPNQERQVDGDGGGGFGLPRAPFAGTLDLPTPPSVYGGCTNASEDGDSDRDEASVSTPSVPVAANRGEPSEGDVEEGRKRAVMVSVAASSADARMRRAKSSSVVAAAAAAEPAVAQPLTYSTAEPAVIENGIVMPCAPSDREKVRLEMRRRQRRGRGRLGVIVGALFYYESSSCFCPGRRGRSSTAIVRILSRL